MKKFLIKEEYINSRLDRWFKKNVFDIPQSLIEKNIRKGNIKINNKKKKSSYRLQKNDHISIYNYNFTPKKNKKLLIKYVPTKKEISSYPNLFIENNNDFVMFPSTNNYFISPNKSKQMNIILTTTYEYI